MFLYKKKWIRNQTDLFLFIKSKDVGGGTDLWNKVSLKINNKLFPFFVSGCPINDVQHRVETFKIERHFRSKFSILGSMLVHQ